MRKTNRSGRFVWTTAIFVTLLYGLFLSLGLYFHLHASLEASAKGEEAAMQEGQYFHLHAALEASAKGEEAAMEEATGQKDNDEEASEKEKGNGEREILEKEQQTGRKEGPPPDENKNGDEKKEKKEKKEEAAMEEATRQKDDDEEASEKEKGNGEREILEKEQQTGRKEGPPPDENKNGDEKKEKKEEAAMEEATRQKDNDEEASEKEKGNGEREVLEKEQQTGRKEGPPPDENKGDEKKEKKEKKELFLDRLNRLLPENDKTTRLTLDRIREIEDELFRFDIPQNVTVQFENDDYVSLHTFGWLFDDQKTALPEGRKCPNCFIRYDKWTSKRNENESYYFDDFVRNSKEGSAAGPADVKVDLGCPKNRRYRQEAPWQVFIGGCGESQKGSGITYSSQGRKHFNYHAGFEKVDNGTFQTTYAHVRLVPPPGMVDGGTGSFPPKTHSFRRVSDFAQRILEEHPRQPLLPPPPPSPGDGVAAVAAAPAMFVHNNCGGSRGSLMTEVIRYMNHGVARYGTCYKNAAVPGAIKPYTTCHRPNDPKFVHQRMLHDDCEAMRDSAKTALSAHHPFVFSLENTRSRDYFTEKRWQALLAGSVPIVWDNDNSLDSLPDPSSAVVLLTGDSMAKSAQKLKKIFQEYIDGRSSASAASSYREQYFGWKKSQTLPAMFVRKMFLSHDFLVCRICEHVAHHHRRSNN